MNRVLLALFFAAIGASLTTPVTDPDFWWHLASGRWMWERGELLRADPFAFTAAQFPPSVAGSFAFTQYWLTELLLYGIHARWGLAGVILLRAAVFTLLFALLYRLMRAVGAGSLTAVLLVALADRTIVDELAYVGDRPQMWSSLLFTATLLLCERQRQGRRWASAGLPALMLLWSNLHGGYLLGLAAVGLSVAAAAVRGSATRGQWASAGASFLLSGCNPGGFSTLLSYVAFRASGSGVLSKIVEESSPLNWLSPLSFARLAPALTALLALSLVLLLPRLRTLARERADLLVLYLGTLAMGLSAVRFLIFFAVVAAVTAALAAGALRERLPALRPGCIGNGLRSTAYAVAVALALVVLAAGQIRTAARTSAFRPGFVQRHPWEGVADYLQQSGLKGNLLNEYGAGGYLAWRLYPSLKVFIYGRALSSELLARYDELLLHPSVPVDGGPRYERELAALGVDAIALPACSSPTGLILPLTVLAARDARWALVYSDETAVVLVNRRTAPAGVLERALPPAALYDNMIALARQAGRSRHGRSVPAWRYSLAFALYAKGERAAALTALDEYLRLAPGHEAARRARERIVRELDAGDITPPPGPVDAEGAGD